jgi:hypothetical protein
MVSHEQRIMKTTCDRCGSAKCTEPESKICDTNLIAKLQKELAQEKKDCIQALQDRDYNGLKWRIFEMECNRLGSTISHNPIHIPGFKRG